MVTSPFSYKEVAERLDALCQKFDEINSSGGYSEQDARYRALKEGRQITNAFFMIVNILSAGEQGKVDLGLMSNIVGDVQTAVINLDNICRASSVTLFQFKVETCFKNLLVGLGMTDPPQGYYNIIQELLARLSIGEKDHVKEVLEIPALIRNSLHSNGFHYGYGGLSRHIEVDGQMYDFVQGGQVNCAGWRHIIHSIMGTLFAIEKILDTPEIKALPDPIEDLYPGNTAS